MKMFRTTLKTGPNQDCLIMIWCMDNNEGTIKEAMKQFNIDVDSENPHKACTTTFKELLTI